MDVMTNHRAGGRGVKPPGIEGMPTKAAFFDNPSKIEHPGLRKSSISRSWPQNVRC